MNPRVKSVTPTKDFKLLLEFTNGERGEFNCSHLLDFGVFTELNDVNYFRQARVQYGTVTWPHEQDICPDTLYCDSEKVLQASEESASYVTSEPQGTIES